MLADSKRSETYNTAVLWGTCIRALWLAAFALLLASLPVRAQKSIPPAERARPALSLDGDWEMAADPFGDAPREAWAKALPSPEQVSIPHAWQGGPATPRVTWYSRAFAFPERMGDSGALLVIENAVGAAEVYLDGQRLAGFFGNGLPRRLPLTGAPKSSHRLTIRLDRAALRAPVQLAASCGLGPISLDMLPPVRLEALIPVLNLEKNTVAVRYRVSADRPGEAELRVELFAPGDKRPLARQSVSLTLPAGILEGELTLTARSLAPWSPEAPRLYRLLGTLTARGRAADTCEVPCGACAVTLSDGALLVNGAPVILKGLRLTGGVPPITRGTLDATLQRELALAKQAGFNAIMGDGAALPEAAIALAGRLGMFVIGEMPLRPQGGEGQDAGLRPEIAAAVEEFGHYPNLIAWSWPSASPLREVSEARAMDPRRLILVRNGADSRAFDPAAPSGQPFLEVDTLVMAAAGTSCPVELPGHDQAPVLVTGVGAVNLDGESPGGSNGSSGQKNGGRADSFDAGIAARYNGEAAIGEQRAVIESVRRAKFPLGYFVRPPRGGTWTGLSTPSGLPTAAFAAALAYNSPCLITVCANPEVALGQPLKVDAVIVNDLRMVGAYRLYQLMTTPTGLSRMSGAELKLTGSRVQDISTLAAFSAEQTGEYRLHLILTKGNTVLASAQTEVIVEDGEPAASRSVP